MISIVAHDAGGAEIVSSYIKQKGLDCLYSLGGPALSIFKRKLGRVRVVSLEESILNSEWVLCGTSWQSNLEWQAIGLAKTQGKKTVAFLDHWINYEESDL